jgi:hypothetical protein
VNLLLREYIQGMPTALKMARESHRAIYIILCRSIHHPWHSSSKQPRHTLQRRQKQGWTSKREVVQFRGAGLQVSSANGLKLLERLTFSG